MDSATAVPEKSAGKKKPKTVSVFYNGRTEAFDYEAEESVKALLDQALQRFGVVQNPHMMSLFNEAGAELKDDETLKKAKVKAGDELVLRQSAVKGG